MSGSWLGPFEQAGSGIIYRIDLEVREQAFRMLAAIAMSAVDLVECGRAANRLAMRAPGRIAAIVGRAEQAERRRAHRRRHVHQPAVVSDIETRPLQAGGGFRQAQPQKVDEIEFRQGIVDRPGIGLVVGAAQHRHPGAGHRPSGPVKRRMNSANFSGGQTL